ncbi:MAG: hypothetical protein H0X37_22790 [Herpetosiphonaceae bacterium]|nr:hypothetical protein [Herpetosiphonaceae bacterium]
MSEEAIPISFEITGQTYSGTATHMQIVHQLIEQVIPHNYLAASRVTVRRPDGRTGYLHHPVYFCGCAKYSVLRGLWAKRVSR